MQELEWIAATSESSTVSEWNPHGLIHLEFFDKRIIDCYLCELSLHSLGLFIRVQTTEVI